MLSFRLLVVPCLILAALTNAQRTTSINADGESVILSIATDADGDPSATTTISTIAAVELASTVGNGGQVATRATCTTEGCPVLPTTYTQAGAIVTWFATTPATPIPTIRSSGRVQQAASYISTTVTTGRSAAGRSVDMSWLNHVGGMGFIALLGGLLGALFVL